MPLLIACDINKMCAFCGFI